MSSFEDTGALSVIECVHHAEKYFTLAGRLRTELLMTTLNWLHITDIHLGMKDRGLWAGSKQIMLDDLARATAAIGPWDLVLLTGDLAFSGKAEEYRLVDAALDEIWQVLCKGHASAPSPLLLAVPGNHDMARPDKEDAIAQGLLTSDRAREGLWKGNRATAQNVQGWFAEYDTWWNGCRYRPKTGLNTGLLPGDFLYTYRKESLEIGLVGMNSAFLDVSDEIVEGQLWMELRQLASASTDLPAWLRQHTLTFLLTHHPVKWLSPESQEHYRAAIAPPGRFTAHLCGHLHEAFAEERSVGAGEASRIWQAPSLFGLETVRGTFQRRHGYTAGRITTEGDSLQSRRWPRQAFKGQDGAYRMTADVTYRLKNDLLETPEESLPRIGSPLLMPGMVPPVIAAKPARSKTWREAALTSTLCKSMVAARDPSKTADLVDLAAKIVGICYETCEQAMSAVPANPWHDEHYPLRVLDRLDVVIGNPPSAEEAFLLLVTPFVRESIFATGALWMADVKPLCVNDTSATTEPRNTLEQIHRARPDLLRRVEHLEGAEREAVCYWMMERALQHSPHLRERTPKIAPMQALQQRIEAVVESAGCHTWLGIDHLIRLAWCVAAAPESLEGESGLLREGVIERGRARLRLPMMAHLLSLSGLEALDLRMADELVVEHVGREGFTPAILRDALRAAQWTESGGRHEVTLACEHPVVDFALEDMTARARVAAERIRHTTENEGRPLMSVPAGIAAYTEPATGPDGRPRYQRPLVHFRLDHNRIRELLMGEQLYGDPMLAVREMYQNALDACRYRQARVTFLKRIGKYLGPPYVGRIRFRQDVDTAGRAFIECDDNGVGMTSAILEHVFAVAGRRFHDLPEFVEERADWQRIESPVQLYPNSQFGIGVLGYFMLADEILVATRRYERDGRLGKVLTVRISSASGLFRFEEGRDEDMPDAGTRVRLLLASNTYKKENEVVRISLCDTLGTLLWIADFDTIAEEAGQAPLHWPGGIPAPGGKPAPAWQFCSTEDPDVHWVARDGENLADDEVRGIERVPVLVDGILTDQQTKSVLVNLRGPRYPRLTVDRKSIRDWNDDWVEDVLARSGHKLVGWIGLTFTFLWAIERQYLRAARTAFEVLEEVDAQLPINLSQPGLTASVRELGSFASDRAIIAILRAGRRPGHLWEAWRATVLIASGFVQPPVGWSPPPRLVGVHIPRPTPGLSSLLTRIDESALSRDRGSLHWFDLEERMSAIFRAAFLCRTTPATVVAWMTQFLPLGIQWPSIPDHLNNIVPKLIDVDLASLIKSSSRLNEPIPIGAVLQVSMRHNISIKGTFERCIAFGLTVPKVDWESFDDIVPSALDLAILSRDLDGAAPWNSADISFTHINRACEEFRVSEQVVIERLKSLVPLGLRVPGRDDDVLTGSISDGHILSENLGGNPPWLSGDVPLGHIVAASLKVRIPPSRVIERIEGFATVLGLRLPNFRPEQLDAAGLTELDLKWLSIDGDARHPWHGMVVPVGSILRASHYTGMDTMGLVDRCRELGIEFRGDIERLQSDVRLSREEQVFLSSNDPRTRALGESWAANSIIMVAQRGDLSINQSLTVAVRLGLVAEPFQTALATLGDHRPDYLDVRLSDCFRAVRRHEDSIAQARLVVWELKEDELLERIERLRPVLDHISADDEIY